MRHDEDPMEDCAKLLLLGIGVVSSLLLLTVLVSVIVRAILS